jgi:hypothetical protein
MITFPPIKNVLLSYWLSSKQETGIKISADYTGDGIEKCAPVHYHSAAG